MLLEDLMEVNFNVPKNIQSMLNAWEEITEPNPLDDTTRIYGGAKIALKPTLNKSGVYMDISSMEEGKGHASKALAKITELADEFSVIIVLVAKPFGTGRLDADALVAWYKKNGFISDPDYPDSQEAFNNGDKSAGLPMVRHPQPGVIKLSGKMKSIDMDDDFEDEEQ
jgi:hypothetical protein